MSRSTGGLVYARAGMGSYKPYRVSTLTGFARMVKEPASALVLAKYADADGAEYVRITGSEGFVAVFVRHRGDDFASLPTDREAGLLQQDIVRFIKEETLDAVR